MTNNRTLTIIKPGAFKRDKTGEILKIIENAGFKIKAMKLLKMTKKNAENFYAIHKGKDFYNDLVEFMSSGYIVAAILEKENAVEDFRTLIGNTDPAIAAEGTIRHLYGVSVKENAVHGSDSDTNAIKECAFFFSQLEIID